MPLYEYVCSDCDIRFDQLRRVARMDEPASCPQGHADSRRVLSMFAALTKDGIGEGVAMGGGGGCGGGCANCACSAN
jgi:putative FmdB family regulatory protein